MRIGGGAALAPTTQAMKPRAASKLRKGTDLGAFINFYGPHRVFRQLLARHWLDQISAPAPASRFHRGELPAQDRHSAIPQPNRAKRMECVELAPAVERRGSSKAGASSTHSIRSATRHVPKILSEQCNFEP